MIDTSRFQSSKNDLFPPASSSFSTGQPLTNRTKAPCLLPENKDSRPPKNTLPELLTEGPTALASPRKEFIKSGITKLS